MNFFKKLFSSKQEQPKTESSGSNKVSEIGTKESFDKRFTEKAIDASTVDGSLKMVESFLIENPLNHPSNLDQVVDEGLGFQMYCKAFQMEDSMIIGTLAIAFSDYMTKKLDFKMFNDNTPESPQRSMVLKYDKNGAVLSLYPFEYSLKVLNYEATFEELYLKVESQLENLPTVDDLLK